MSGPGLCHTDPHYFRDIMTPMSRVTRYVTLSCDSEMTLALICMQQTPAADGRNKHNPCHKQ